MFRNILQGLGRAKLFSLDGKPSQKYHEKRRHKRETHPGGVESPIRFELFSNERFEQHARSLAKTQKISRSKTPIKLLPRVQENSRVLVSSYKNIARAVHEQRSITPAAEWLLDNFHVIEGQFDDVLANVPEKYYEELPNLADGHLKHFPRIYGIAWALVAHTDSRFDVEKLKLFIRTYQTVQPLNLGELWALPITLRLLMIENLRRVALLIIQAQRGRQLADTFIDKIEHAASQFDNPAEHIPPMQWPIPELRQSFAVQIVQRLHDPHPGVNFHFDFLNEWLTREGLSIEEIVQREHAQQIANNTTVRNIIVSMRAISNFDWTQFFEEINLVDASLRLNQGYQDMDFLTRDRYRKSIEELAKRSSLSEVDIAKRAVINAQKNQATSNPNLKKHDAGYFLIGAGRYTFEKEVGYKPLLKQYLLRACMARAGLAYMTTLLLLTAFLLAIPLTITIDAGLNSYTLFFIAFFGLFPASDMAVSLINRLVIAILPPHHVPRLDLKDTVPDNMATFVVVPTMFFNEKGVKEQIDEMEVRYLGNPGGRVYFALISDWADADQEVMPNDKFLLDIALAGVDRLNTKYNEQRFFVFHRRRLWNPSEGKWMGWERKRGKLHEFNRLLRGATDTSFLPIHNQPVIAPAGISYVITLDADTKLPMGVVPQLVGVAAHPLNKPVLNPHTKCVEEGYSIIQPRVTPALPQRQERSIFHRIFAGATGIDSYSSEVSELYQDLFNFGTYTGKGLYHLDMFETALHGRVPENSQLSHDLFESVYASCALVSDIEFFEDYPSHIDVASSRTHRWVRGDWQLLPWIFGPRGKDMPMIGRWKMLDNLRRSLSAPGAFLTLVSAWIIPHAPDLALIGFVMAALTITAFQDFFYGLIPKIGQFSLQAYLRLTLNNVMSFLIYGLVSLILLAQQASFMMDAILRTLVRLFITKRRLLIWFTALQAKETAGNSLQKLVKPIRHSTFMVLSVGAAILLFNPAEITIAAPFLFLWWLAPFIARTLNITPQVDPEENLLAEDKGQLRLFGRRIWLFFTTFVTVGDNFLPPDNFQEDPNPVVAHRSSPTNFGLYLLSVIAARDFGWIGLIDATDKLENSVQTLTKLQRFNGHFYNWYNTEDLQPLEPRYVSTVDSGNLAGNLLTLAQACREILATPLHLSLVLDGLTDTFALLQTAMADTARNHDSTSIAFQQAHDQLANLGKHLESEKAFPTGWAYLSDTLLPCSESVIEATNAFIKEKNEDDKYETQRWAQLLRDDIQSHVRDLHELAPWVGILSQFKKGKNEVNAHTGWLTVCERLTLEVPLSDLANLYKQVASQLEVLDEEKSTADAGLVSMVDSLNLAASKIGNLTGRLNNLATLCDVLFNEMNFHFLYDTATQLFSIGYQVTDGSLDSNCYDLLASEARLASFIAIAKRDIPVKHWFRLGRRLTQASDGAVLISWSGSMFEYLMPSLITYTPRYSLLDQTCRLVVRQQIEYGKKREVPWGISESAFSVRDQFLTYQYSAFGVPGLGMKRGLEEDLVIAPYATALAAMYLPHDAVDNLEMLEKNGAVGPYGFYEAIDFTPIRLAEDQQSALVKCYMAHHQGMSLVAFDNTVHDGIMRHRFHAVPIIKAANLLLQERVRNNVAKENLTYLDDALESKETNQPPLRQQPSPLSPVPSSHLLSNGRYVVMITAAGSGYSLWQNKAITRWREDVTCSPWGYYIYLRDIVTGKVWSAGYQPIAAQPKNYDVHFAEDRARISRQDGDFHTTMEIIISPDDDVEIRRLSLNNRGDQSREIAVTSYAEIALSSFSADIAHPLFSKMFVHTEFVPQKNVLIARRRPRSASEPEIWAAHFIAGYPFNKGIQYETDRAKFIGRGQTLRKPSVIMDDRILSNTVGAVLDPIFSLRTEANIPPGATEHLTFITMVSSSRKALDELIDKYHNLYAFERVSPIAWTHAQVQMSHFRIKPDEAQLFQHLANRILYADPSLRTSSNLMQMNTLNATYLWRFSISGDLPIILLRVAEPEEHYLIEQLLKAYEYWRLKGLNVDLIVLNDKETSYADEFQRRLESMVRDYQMISAHQEHGYHGSIVVLRADLLSSEELLLIQTVARAVLVGNRGTLAEQLLRNLRPLVPFVHVEEQEELEENSVSIPLPPLRFFNGLGGFSEDGREYVIYLEKGQYTPSPWINVIANDNFGFTVSESGSGFTWCGNSRENQLTPWSNDPVTDSSGEIFYIRDDETNALWNPTALPIRVARNNYLIRHGQGYTRFELVSHGIHSELLQFVAPKDPVKISSLTLKNLSGKTRRLTVAAYVEWVLGTSRSVTAPYIITEQDSLTGALFARNRLNAEFGNCIAFVDCPGRPTQWTGSRSEFIGRNGSIDAPSGLLNRKGLKRHYVAGLDPCAALKTAFTLKPDEQVEIVFLLGQGNDLEHAQDLVKQYRDLNVTELYGHVLDGWEDILTKIQVETPDQALDFLLNRWVLYQTLSCRIWARAAFYQAGGAFGFRDQLQDCMAVAVARPDLTRAHILRAAGRQFVEGDVQHWWHPPTGRGVRTHFSDDRIWLPFVTAYYLKVSGDQKILQELVPFIAGPTLAPDQEDSYYHPDDAQELATLFEHCARALDKSLDTGMHGLPLMGSGDWNDGMNRVGIHGKGESIWLGWFLLATLGEFVSIADAMGDKERAYRWREHINKLKIAIDTEGWDGAWYRRAYFDDGTPLGSASNAECRIDSIAQSWALISGVADKDRASQAMKSFNEYLVRNGDELVLLFTPPFQSMEPDPGYIKYYPQGIRENGGQYTHAAIWAVIAYTILGDGDEAGNLLDMLNPIKRSANRTGVHAYKVEPYVLAADIYAEPPHTRRGGWTWYTGAAGWYYRAGIESLLGLQVRSGALFFKPCIPKCWQQYQIYYRHEKTVYEILVENPHQVCKGIELLELDGESLPVNEGIVLDTEKQKYQVRIVLGNI